MTDDLQVIVPFQPYDSIAEIPVDSYLLHRDPSNLICLQRAVQQDGTVLWAVRSLGSFMPGFTLNKQSEFEFEPLPSSRTRAYLKRCRFPTPEDALAAWNEWIRKNASANEAGGE